MEKQTTNDGNYRKSHDCMETKFDQFYSAEFLLSGINRIYQFKIWKNPSKAMFALVNKNSSILDSLNVGDVLNMKYYSSDTLCPTQMLNTRIKYIAMEDQGKFKGHYMVGLEIAQDEHSNKVH